MLLLSARFAKARWPIIPFCLFKRHHFRNASVSKDVTKVLLMSCLVTQTTVHSRQALRWGGVGCCGVLWGEGVWRRLKWCAKIICKEKWRDRQKDRQTEIESKRKRERVSSSGCTSKGKKNPTKERHRISVSLWSVLFVLPVSAFVLRFIQHWL